ncbi:MAG TPA: efflux RND transporter periplasmic adaptor subunit [bacterium]|jgi:macrolide-specific efflux system membrane fusion protein|nr:efflux RND transporter periplasmic adaptor subunit [bacterium]
MKSKFSKAAILCMALVFTGCTKGKHQDSYKPVTVKRDTIQLTVLATGNIQPNNQLAIFPSISGRIEKILIKEGDTVKKGQELMELSSTERATLLDEAEAQGPKQYKHWQKLYEASPLLSPENGQIIYLPTVPGQVVSTGVTMMVMSDHLMVDTQVDETDLAQVKMNQKATITLDAYPNQHFIGTVKRISYFSVLVNNVTTYEVDVWPDEIPAYMRSGMTANVVFNTTEKDNILTIPSEAIQQVGNQSGVMVPGEKKDDKPVFKPIQTGVTDGKQIEVVSGLKEGDKVLIKTFSVGQLDTTSAGTNPFMPSRAPTGGGARTSGGGGGR